jgi:hypothetical protein
VAGFVLALVSGGLLLVSVGVSSLLSLGLAIFGLVYSRKGQRKVQAGETTKHAELARAGWIISIVCTVLSILATLFWIAVLVLAATSDDFQRELERFRDEQGSVPAVLLGLARIVLSLL